MKDRRQFDVIALIVVLLVGIGLGRVQSGHLARGVVDPVSRSVQAIVLPMANLFRPGLVGASGFFSGIWNAGRLQAENQQLREAAASARLYQSEYISLLQQHERLRLMQRMPNWGRPRIYGDVVAFFPYEQRITLNIGSEQGVQPGRAVVSAEGLLAVISTVDRNRSQALLITNRAQNVGATVVAEPPAIGIARGESARRLVMEIGGGNVVRAGATVSTSGLSEFIPRGVPIGAVSEVVDDRDYGVRRVIIVPFADVARVNEVAVIL